MGTGSIILVIIGVVLLLFFGLPIYGGYEADSSWKAVPGTVTNTFLQQGYKGSILPCVSYSYDSGNTSFGGTSCQVDYFTNLTSLTVLNETYYLGKNVDILVDPTNMHDSKLKDFTQPFSLAQVIPFLLALLITAKGVSGLLPKKQTRPS